METMQIRKSRCLAGGWQIRSMYSQSQTGDKDIKNPLVRGLENRELVIHHTVMLLLYQCRLDQYLRARNLRHQRLF